MDVRGPRHLETAAIFDLCKQGDDRIALSHSGKGTYRVQMGKPHPTFTCPDRRLRRVKRKHIRSIESIKREKTLDGRTDITEIKTTTYSRNSPSTTKRRPTKP